MTTVTLELPENVYATLRRSPEEFARELRLAAAIHWYSQGQLSQSKNAGGSPPETGAWLRRLSSMPAAAAPAWVPWALAQVGE